MIYESLFRNLLYPFYEGGLRGRNTFKYLKKYERNQWLAPEQILQIQWQALQALIAHCHQQVPYYRKLWDSLDIHPNDIKSQRDFAQLPVLTKAIVKANYNELIARNFIGKTLTKTTGGSTGEPFKFEYTRESYERRTAISWRGYAWSGLPIGKQVAYLWGTDLGEVSRSSRWKNALYNWALNRRMLNSFAMTRENMESYVDALNDYQAEGIVAYVAPLYTLAEFIRKKNLDIFSPKVIITGAEPLLDFQRELIQEVFKCPVSNTYGCREVMLIAAECTEKTGLHINQDHLLVETLDSAGFSIRNSSGRIAITDLYNYGMPLVRYINGDMATLGDDSCACGRGLALMSSIEGRELDSIRTKGGSILPGEFFPHLLKDIEGLECYQVVQESLAGVDILMVCNHSFDHSALNYISSEIQKVIGDEFEVNYKFVEEIALTKSGKRRVTVSKIH